MSGVSSKPFDKPDATRALGSAQTDIVELEGATVARMRAEPGWRWSEDVKPIVGGDHCQALHLGYCISGSLHVVHQDGTETDISPGDTYVIKPDHDAWVTSDNTFEALEFQSDTAAGYAAAP